MVWVCARVLPRILQAAEDRPVELVELEQQEFYTQVRVTPSNYC
jgi:hypothetical protein